MKKVKLSKSPTSKSYSRFQILDSRFPSNSQASALLITILVMGVVLVVALAFSQLMVTEYRLAYAIDKSIVAYYAAETGIEVGLLDYKDDQNVTIPASQPVWLDSPTNQVGYTLAFDSTNKVISSTGQAYGVTRKLEITIPINPVAWWKLDEIIGDKTPDASGNNNEAELENGPTLTTGKIGQALSFNGVNQYLEVSNSPTLTYVSGNPITMIAWLKPNLPITPRNIFGKEGPNLALRIRSSFEVDVWVGSSTSPVLNVPSITSQWYMIAYTYSSSAGSTLYWFDPSSPTPIIGNSAAIPVSDSDDVLIGNGYQNLYFNGLLDEVRIYNQALSEAQIQAIYDQEK